MVRVKTKRIGEFEYVVTSFPARQGLGLKLRLGKLFAPVFGTLDNLTDKDQITLAMISKMISTALDALTPDEFIQLTTDLCSKTVFCVPGKPAAVLSGEEFDQIFSDNYTEMYELLQFILEVNYKDFFTKAGTGMKAFLPAMNMTQSPKTTLNSSEAS